MSNDLSAKESQIRELPGALERVLMLARVLRAPGGCPWDREQTVDSLTPYLQEETYEVVEAVGSGNKEGFREEMGDLLFLVLSLAITGEDTGWSTVDEMADHVVDKLIRRHPHVFGGGPQLESDGALRQWEAIKRAEGENDGEVPSALGRRPRGLPALTTAFRISEKAGAVGFEWADVRGALKKLEEEMAELHHEVEAGADRESLERELGDVLYSLVNISRYLKVDPERALRTTTTTFINRFRYIEEQLHKESKTPEEASLEEMDALWEKAKREGIT